MTDISELVQKIKAAAEKATPGKWMWWTSNSFLRLSSDASAKDGGVIDSYRMTDGHTSLQVSKADQDFIALACPENIRALTGALDSQKQYYESVIADGSKRIAELEKIRSAAEKLVRCKGRYHSEQNYRALAALFGVTTPDLPPLDGEPIKVNLPPELYSIGEQIRTQDNRVTSDPLFCVFQKREIVVDADYDYDRIVWVDDEGIEASKQKERRLKLLHDDCRDLPDPWRRLAIKEVNDFVTACFTEQGCKDYLACNGHNLRQPFISVRSGFRNAEYIGLRNWISGIKLEYE